MQPILASVLLAGTLLASPSPSEVGTTLWAGLAGSGPVQIMSQPADLSLSVGQRATFAIQLAGAPPHFMQWCRDGTETVGATNLTLTISNAAFADSGPYSCQVSNALGTAWSAEAVLVVNEAPVELLPFFHTWRFETTGRNLGTDWREADYDDSAWPAGPGPLGDETSTLPEPIRTPFNRVSGNFTYYFRTEFEFQEYPPDVELAWVAEVDDGAVAYLNGVEVWRVGMSSGPVLFNTAANRTVGNAALESFLTSNLGLRQGRNVLAVEVHDINGTGSDVVMGLRLAANPLPMRLLSITRQPVDLTVEEVKPATFTVEVEGGRERYQWFKDGTAIVGASDSIYAIPEADPSDAGTYHVIVSNLVSQVRSQDAVLRVVPDTTPPVLVQADGSASPDTVTVSFSERVTEGTASDPAHYVLTNTMGGTLEIHAASLTNGTNVILFTGPRVDDCNYVVYVTGVEDPAAGRNAIAPGSAIPVSTVVSLLALNSTWSFYNPYPGLDEPDLGTAWRHPDYQAEWWGSGPGVFWLGASSIAAPRGAKLSQGAVTSYFRTWLRYEVSPAGAQLFLRYLVNDGAVFYWNGLEILRVNLPTGQVDYLTPAGSDGLGYAPDWIELDPSLFIAKENLLATELHGISSTDDDLLFGCELAVRIQSLAVGPLLITRQPSDQVVVEGEPCAVSCMVVGADRFQWHVNGSAVAGATNHFYLLPVTPLDWDGALVQVEAASDWGMILSQQARLTVQADREAPQLLSAWAETERLKVSFSEPLSPSSATNPANYEVIDRLGQNRLLLQVELFGADTVVLTTQSPLQVGDSLVVNRVQDASRAANAILPNSKVMVGFSGFLVPIAGEWRFDQSGSNLGTAWRETDFDDSGWPAGPGPFGAETSPLPEPLRTPLTPPSAGGPITVYFRTHLSFPDIPSGMTLQLRYLADDGAVFYLNGQEFHRVGVPLGQNQATLASRVVGTAAYEGPFDLTLPSLRTGDNVLAVELHQASSANNDVIFGAELSMPEVPSEVVPRLVLAPLPDGRITLAWDGSGYLLEQSDSLPGPWSTAPDQANPQVLDPRAVPLHAMFYRLRRAW